MQDKRKFAKFRALRAGHSINGHSGMAEVSTLLIVVNVVDERLVR